MAYCTNCGNEIKNNVKFCPNCGAQVKTGAQKAERRPSPKRRMQKGVVKSLEDTVENTVQKEIEKSVQSKVEVVKPISKQKELNEPKTIESHKPQKKSIYSSLIVYIIINFLLLYGFGNQDIVIGTVFFSVLFFIIYAYRRKKSKPFNFLIKIILILQAIITFSILMQYIKFLDDPYSLMLFLLVTSLFLVILHLLFKGNK